ncbi:MAG: hypothetical protein P4N59_18245 [Negativicutes bacterium]|nr:hypothetical protein [Negativicutes bacterium]
MRRESTRGYFDDDEDNKYQLPDPAFVARMLNLGARPFDASPDANRGGNYVLESLDGGGGGDGGGDTADSQVAQSNQENRQYHIHYSRDDQRIYWVDSQTGQPVKFWECRSDFVPVDETGDTHETLPNGTYQNVTAELNSYGKPYGTFYITTGDSRARDIHGGGSGLGDPFAPQQGWVPTYGCLRMQNADGEELSKLIMNQGNARLVVGKDAFNPPYIGPTKSV